MTWSLVQYEAHDGPRLGVAAGDTIRELPPKLSDFRLTEVLDEWDRWSPSLRCLDVDALPTVTDARLVAPLTYPRKLLCAGVNYYDHAEEMGTERPDPEDAPYFFLKTPTTTIVGPDTPVAIPDEPTANVDWEVELGVVIARTCRDITPSQATDHIAGYVVANDISARGLFHRPEAVYPAFGWDWFSHKNHDGFCPIGPGLVPAWLVPDPQALKIRLTVNGELKQDSSTAAMVSNVDDLVAAASHITTLEPGDLVLTGTPAGVGMPRKDFLSPGDVVTAEIEGLGRLSNPIVTRRQEGEHD